MVDLESGFSRSSSIALGLVFLGVCSCGGSSDERRPSETQGGAGGSGNETGAGRAGATEGGTSGSGGAAPTGGTSSPGGSGSGGSGGAGGTASGEAGDSGQGGASGSSGAGGSGGASVSYAACQFGSGIARTVIAKRDGARDRCVVLILNQPGTNTLGLTLPMSWGVEAAFSSSPATADCLMRFPPTGGVSAESGTGSVARQTGFVVDVDVTLAFPGGVMEILEATGLDAQRGCTL